MSEPEGVKMSLTCGPGMCDMDTASTKDGPRMFAGGADGLLKAYATKNLEEPVAELNLDVDDEGDDGFAVTAVATSPIGEELAVGLKNGDVKLYELPSLEFKTMLTRFTAPVIGLDYGMKDGGVIAACSEEPGVKLVRRSDSSKVLVLNDFDGGTKSVEWDPRGEFLAASGFDGTVKVWRVDPSLDDLTTEVVHTERYFAKEAAGLEFEHLGKVSWHPEGKSLSVTGSTDPLMLARDSWDRSIIVPENAEEEGHVKEITATAFSPDGRFLATAALDGRVVLWNTEEKLGVHTFVNTEQENWRHLKWLDGSTVAALSIGGSVCTLKHAPPATKKAATSDKSKSSAEDPAGVEDEGAGSDRDGESSGDKQKRGSSKPKHLFDEEAAEDNDGNVSEADTAEIEDGAGDVAAGDVTAGLDDSIDSGNGGGRYDNGEAGEGDGTGIGDDDNLLDITGPMEPASMVPRVETTPLQDPFQPSSTPLGDARRYLCWNRVGTIISVDENTHNAVEIEFADKSAGRNQRFMDTWNFVMGALSSTGAVFASVAQEEDESAPEPSPSGGRSVLYYKGLGRHSTGEDWTRMMPAGETVLAVSVGRGWAAAATDRQLVRFFTASGLQGETIMLPGPVVTMAGGGDVLMVVYHKGEPLGESQNLGYQLFDVGGRRELSTGAVCLSPASELTWLSVSEEGMVVSMDSAGLISALTRSFGWQWTPLLDTLKVSKNKRDRFWPVGLVTGKLLAVTLKGGEEHPAAYPRPVLTAVSLTALCTKSRDGEEMARFERSFPAMEGRARQRKFNLDRGLSMGDDAADAEEMEGELMAQQAALDTMVVKRIQEACAAESAERAMDLASLLHLEKSYSIAIKVANHHGLTSLAAGMEDAMVAKFQGPEDEEDFDDERVEVLEDRGWMRGGGASSASGGADGNEQEESLGPLDRARLQQARRKKSEDSVSPPPRPTIPSSSAIAAGDRYDGSDDDGYTSEAAVGGGDADGAEIVDSDDDGDNTAATVSPKAKGGDHGGGGGGGLKRRMHDGEEEEDASGDEGDDAGDGEEEEEVEAPPAPRNPFARGGKTFASPPKKKRKGVLETMNDLRSSPSPVSTKRPPLSRLSSFAAEARHKNRNDRNVL